MRVRPKLLTVSCMTLGMILLLTPGCTDDSAGASGGIAALSTFAIDLVRQIFAAFLF